MIARPKECALSLALFRVVVTFLTLVTNEPVDALALIRAQRPLVAPEGLGWFLAHAPLDERTATIVRVVYYVAGAFSLVGIYTRFSLGALLVTGFYLFATTQLAGAVFHDMHMLWFVALLALSPSGGVLSLDAWMDRKDLPWKERLLGTTAHAESYGFPLFFARTLLGVIYFFPGLWKLRESGLAWALSDNLANQMHAKWFEYGRIPMPRIDEYPFLLKVGGLATIAFELSFIVLVHIGPRMRVALAMAGIAFHLSIQHFLLIPFASLWLSYVALVDWSRFAVGRGSEQSAPSDRRALVLVGALMLLANVERGLRGKSQSFPFACYPTFQWMVGPGLADLRLIAIRDDGEVEIRHARDAAGARSQQEWGAVWSIAGIYGVPFSEERLHRYLLSESKRPSVSRALADARRVRAELVEVSVDPAKWRAPPRIVRVLATIDAEPVRQGAQGAR